MPRQCRRLHQDRVGAPGRNASEVAIILNIYRRIPQNRVIRVNVTDKAYEGTT